MNPLGPAAQQILDGFRAFRDAPHNAAETLYFGGVQFQRPIGIGEAERIHHHLPREERFGLSAVASSKLRYRVVTSNRAIE